MQILICNPVPSGARVAGSLTSFQEADVIPVTTLGTAKGILYKEEFGGLQSGRSNFCDLGQFT